MGVAISNDLMLPVIILPVNWLVKKKTLSFQILLISCSPVFDHARRKNNRIFKKKKNPH
jgi:hypothetical protein